MEKYAVIIAGGGVTVLPLSGVWNHYSMPPDRDNPATVHEQLRHKLHSNEVMEWQSEKCKKNAEPPIISAEGYCHLSPRRERENNTRFA